MDPDLIWTLSLAAALGSVAAHYASGRFLSRRLTAHLESAHEQGWRACGGTPRGDRPPDGSTISHYGAWRWLYRQLRRGWECDDCARLARSGKLLAASAASATFLFLAIGEIWGR